jgi:hypothetical protein
MAMAHSGRGILLFERRITDIPPEEISAEFNTFEWSAEQPPETDNRYQDLPQSRDPHMPQSFVIDGTTPG